MGIHELEEQLFQEWEEHLKQRMDSETVVKRMCFDGLHYTGTPDKNLGYWKMKPDNKEEELWKTAKIRPLFLTKDHNLRGDEEGVDTREETGLDNDTDEVYYPFYAKYLMLLYGLTQINLENGSYLPLEKANDSELYCDNFYKVPVVRMNLKKIAGQSSCPDGVLEDYIKNDKDFIRRQIALYNSNIIVCCHGGNKDVNPVMHLLDELYPGLQRAKIDGKESYTVYYSAEAKVVVLHVWHPSMPGLSYEENYSAVPELAKFLQENPNAIG